MQHILITGAAGFIGWKTTEAVLERGARVTALDNMNDYYDVRLKRYRMEELNRRGNFTFHEMDIEDLPALRRLFDAEQFDAVINLAARAGVRYSMENPHVYMSTNAQGTLNLLELMRARGIRKMVLASTSSLYAGQPMPFKEDLPVNTPISPYAASKKAAELMTYTYHYHFDMDISVLRYFTVYGPAGRPDMSIFRFIQWIDQEKPIEVFGDGTQSRDFTYVDDIAEGTVRALKEIGYEIINLGGGKDPIALSDVIGKLENLLGKKATTVHKPFHKADLKATWADITKAGSILGWEPATGIDEGLQRSVEWYEKNRPLAEKIVLP